MYNISSAMANQFAEISKEMTDEISKLGNNPLRNTLSLPNSSNEEN
jgi:coenzyme F420-reducing hydrogenase delta subunit